MFARDIPNPLNSLQLLTLALHGIEDKGLEKNSR